jgi:transcriptional regulator with XRE-family HTH domain
VISPYVRRLRLAAELRAVRTDRGLTHHELAKMIGQSRAQVSRLENGHVVDQADIMAILEALEVDDERWTTIMTVAREAAERGWWESVKGMAPRDTLHADLEAGARTISEYQLSCIPALLQTEQYAAFRAGVEQPEGASGNGPDQALLAREGRQRMLCRPGGPAYEVILDELAVLRHAAPLELVRKQLYHVSGRANADPDTTIRVLPVDAYVDDYGVPRSAFSVFTYPDPGDPRIVTVDTVSQDLVITDEPGVKRYEDLFQRLRHAALSPWDSLRFIVDAASHRG